MQEDYLFRYFMCSLVSHETYVIALITITFSLFFQNTTYITTLITIIFTVS